MRPTAKKKKLNKQDKIQPPAYVGKIRVNGKRDRVNTMD